MVIKQKLQLVKCFTNYQEKLLRKVWQLDIKKLFNSLFVYSVYEPSLTKIALAFLGLLCENVAHISMLSFDLATTCDGKALFST